MMFSQKFSPLLFIFVYLTTYSVSAQEGTVTAASAHMSDSSGYQYSGSGGGSYYPGSSGYGFARTMIDQLPAIQEAYEARMREEEADRLRRRQEFQSYSSQANKEQLKTKSKKAKVSKFVPVDDFESYYYTYRFIEEELGKKRWANREQSKNDKIKAKLHREAQEKAEQRRQQEREVERLRRLRKNEESRRARQARTAEANRTQKAVPPKEGNWIKNLVSKGVNALCFTADTPVCVTREKSKPIEKVQTGDFVLSCSLKYGRNLCQYQRVQQVSKRITNYLLKLSYNGKTLRCTPEHPFYVPAQRKWVKARNLKPGDQLYTVSGEEARIEHIKEEFGQFDVYNLDVQRNHNYFAAEVLVHNCNLFGRPTSDAAAKQAEKKTNTGIAHCAGQRGATRASAAGNMQAYKDLNRQLGARGFPPNRVRGPEVHPNRLYGKEPHGHEGLCR